MKKIVLIISIIVIIYMQGCTTAENFDWKQSDVLDVFYERINLDLPGDETKRIIYADEEYLIFVIDERVDGEIESVFDFNDVMLYMYNLKDKDIEMVIDISDFEINSISGAVPYNEGVVYANYLQIDEGYMWKIQYCDGKQNITIKDGLNKGAFPAPPVFSKVSDIPIVAYQLSTEEKCYFVIEKVINDTLVKIYESDEFVQKDDIILDNGKEYGVSVTRKKDDKDIIIVGNDSTVLNEIITKKPLQSFAITKNDVVYSYGDIGEGKIETVNFETTDRNENKTIKQFYRITGSDGDYSVCVDEGFNPYIISSSRNDIKSISLPKEFENDTPALSFYHTSGKEFVVEFWDKGYYYMKLPDYL